MSKKEDILLRKKIADALIKARKIVADHKSEYHGKYFSSGGGGTTTSNSSSTVPASVLSEYNQVTNQANQVAGAPLNQYGGQIVAGLTPDEMSAFSSIDNMQGITAPYTGSASNLIGQATQNINPNTVTAGDIQNYESPYTQNVLNSTVAEENNQDAQQQAQLQGNAISSGAWGGDRSAVAGGILGGQQALANNATNAGILNQGYSQALQEANTQQQAALGAQEASQYLQESGGLAENQIGQTAQAEGLTGANAQLTSGQLQQQQAQSELNVPYEQFLQEQAYPFQTTGWLGNIAEGIGSNEGGSSTSSTTQPSEGLFGLRRGGGITPRHLAIGGTSNAAPVFKPIIRDSQAGMPGYGETAYENELKTYNASPSTAPAPAGNGQFSAQKAPTYSQFAARSPNNTSYNGGIIPNLNSANQSDLSSIYSGKFAKGGIVPHRDAGGVTPFTQSINPVQNNITNNYSQMSLQQLQQLAQRIPPGSPQGQAVQKALQQKQFMPNVGSGMKRGGIIPQHFDAGGTGGVAVSPDGGDTLVDSTIPPDNGYGHMLDVASGDTTAPITAPPPTPPVNAPDHPSNSGYVPDMPANHEANPWLSVAAGVLGTLAGRSRNPLVDIGQGGLIGINNYAAQNKQAQEQNYTEGTFHQNAQKLMDEAQLEKDKFAQEKTNESDLQQYRQGELGNQASDLAIRKQEASKPIFDKYGNPWQLNPQTKTYTRVDLPANGGTSTEPGQVNNNPRDAAVDILQEEGSPLLPVAPNDTNAFKAQQSYQSAAQTAQSMLDTLNRQKSLIGKYTSGPRGAANTNWLPSEAGLKYGAGELAAGNSDDLAARQEAEKDANTLAMQQSALLKGARPGVRMIQFSGTTVPNPGMSDKAQHELADEWTDRLNQQIQRGQIASTYSGMHPKNVDAIINNYETNNPITLSDGSRNPNWMNYRDWIKSGRPDTSKMAQQNSSSSASRPPLSSFMRGQ